MALDFKRERLVAWLVTPPKEREPQTQVELAAELGTSPPTLAKWKTEPEVVKAWEAKYRETVGNPEVKLKIMQALASTAGDRDDPKHVQAAKTYFEIEGSVKPPSLEVTVTSKPSELSDDELRRLMALKAEDELSRRRERDVG